MNAASFVADLEDIEYTVAPGGADGIYRMRPEKAFKGMYVERIDRPWQDTPFPSGGFLIEHDAQIAALRRHCRSIGVNADLSDAFLLGAIRAGAALFDEHDDSPDTVPMPAGFEFAGSPEAGRARMPGAARPDVDGRAAPLAPRADVRIPRRSRAKVRELLVKTGGERAAPDAAPAAPAAAAPAGSGVAARLRRLLRAGPLRRGGGGPAPIDAIEASDLSLPDSEQYPDRVPMALAVAAARPVHARAHAALVQLNRQARAGRALDLRPLSASAVELARCAVDNPDALLWCERVYAQRHASSAPSLQLALVLLKFGRHLGVPRPLLADLALTGMIADIGKLRLSRTLLDRPGMLDPVAFEAVKAHVALGVELLRGCDALPPGVLRAVSEHHERIDGSGYPMGLRAGSVSLAGAMTGIADCFTALTTPRPYANALSVEDTLAALHDWSGRLFPSGLVEHFIVATGLFPVGSLVELSGGEVAMVVDRHPEIPLQSRVVVIADTDKGPLRPQRGHGGPAAEPDARFDGARLEIHRGLPVGAFGLSLKDCYAAPPGRITAGFESS